MNSFGKSIRIYLKDGSVTGIKFGEVVNHTIQSISCPRLRLNELNEHSEAKRPGIYFLFGQDETTGENKAYIGEAENVLDRLQHHIANKDFWNEAVLFISKDENLTKSHVKYLESRLIQLSLTIKRYQLDNFNQSQLSSLPRADRDAMEEFLYHIKLLIGVLGHKILEEITFKFIEKKDNILPKLPSENQVTTDEINVTFYLSVAGINAKAIQTNEGIVVLEGSQAAKEFTDSLSFGYRKRREELIKSETLSFKNDKYVFTTNTLFDSPSQAAAIIVGYSINGPWTWKNFEGKSLRDIEKERVETSSKN